MRTVQKTITKEPGPVARARALGLTGQEYSHLGKFSNACDELGLKTTSIGKALGLGCRLQLSGRHDYEVLLNGGIALLGRIEKDGRRVKLHSTGTATEGQWESVLAAIKKSEGRI